MPKIIPLESGNFYHIFNHGVGGRKLFREKGNYEHFLKQYHKYIDPVVDTYAWTLMPNHFHWLVRVKEDLVYKYSNADGSVDAARFDDVKWETVVKFDDPSASDVIKKDEKSGIKLGSNKKVDPSRHFSHFFNSHTKYINRKYNTYGTLFERPFRRKLVDSEAYRNRLLVYIHNNPVHHGFCRHPLEYSWSSYINYMTDKPGEMQREVIEDWFGGMANFKYMHGEEQAGKQSFEPFWD